MSQKNNRDKSIQSSKKKILVSAGAGTGKTTVLVERYLRILISGEVNLEEILAITFTEKAAQEMKERIFLRLLEKERFDLIEKFNNAKIHTIHGFCSGILKDYSFEAEIDPDFQLIAYPELILDQVFDTLFSEAFLTKDTAIMNLLVVYKHDSLKNSIISVYEKLRTSGIDLKDIESLVPDEKLIKETFTVFRRRVSDYIHTWKGVKTSAAIEKYLYNMNILNEEYLKEVDLPDLECITEIDKVFSVIRKQGKQEFHLELFPIKDLYKELYLIFIDYYGAVEFIPMFLNLLQRFHKSYESEKQMRGLLDFQDLLLKVQQLLKTQPEIRESIINRYKHIMVDELQDTNKLQMKIISYLFKASTGAFYVGDIKQSIYAFRDADIAGFRDLHRKIKTEKKADEELIVLDESFRSRKPIIEFINGFFSSLWTDSKELEYEELKSIFNYSPKKTPSLEIIMTTGLLAEQSRETAAGTIMDRIKDIVEHKKFKVFDKKLKSERDVEYGDIAILLPVFTGYYIYENALKSRDIPYYIVSGWGYFFRDEIKDLLNYCNILLNPLDNFTLLKILRSYFVNIGMDTLFYLSGLYFNSKAKKSKVKSEDHVYYLFEQLHLVEDNKNIPAEDKVKIKDFLEKFSKLRESLGDLSLTDYIDLIINITGYGKYILTGKTASRAYANIMKFKDLALVFEMENGASFAEFIGNINQLTVSEVRQSEAQITAEKSNVVRIMTIHQAKGLEFPVVIVADCGRKFKDQTIDIFDFESEMGFVVKPYNHISDNIETKSYKILLLKEKLTTKFTEEKKRLFYVACTRSREHLMISGRADTGEGTWMKWLFDYIQSDNFNQELLKEDLVITTLTDPTVWIPSRKAYRWRELVNTPSDKVNSFIKKKAKLENIPRENINEINRRVFDFQFKNSDNDFRLELTPSKLMLINKCEKKFFLRYIKRVKPFNLEEKRDTSSMGIQIHELFKQIEFRDYSRNEIHRILQNQDFEKKFLDKFSSNISNFLNGEIWKEIKLSNKVLREVPFTFNFNDAILQGQIDILFHSKKLDGFWVIDYKSNILSKNKIDEVFNEYKLQLAIYSEAIKQVFGEYPKNSGLYFLFPEVYKELTSTDLKLELEKVANSISRIKLLNKQNLKMNLSHCDNCEFKELCKQVKFD